MEDLGLLKLDLLSLRTFTAVEIATQKIAEVHPDFSYDTIALTDDKTYARILEEWQEIPELRQYENEDVLKRVLTWAEKIEGVPRHLGTHLGGVVVSRDPLSWVSPRERSAPGDFYFAYRY